MGEVRVVDRGAREIVVFLSGDITDGMEAQLNAAIDEVDSLEHLSLLNRAVIDLRDVTRMDPVGVAFMQALQQRGQQHDFDVDLTTISGPAHRALEKAHWPVAIGEGPGASEPRGPVGEAEQRTTES
jgi:anti-anti-sigma regulatory factor